MTLLVPNAGEVAMANFIFNKAAQENFTLRAYTNNITPAETDTTATYTEAAGNGYAAIALIAANWTVTGGNPTTVAAPQQTWTFTGNLGNVYGYYFNGTTSTTLMWAERFSDGPYNIFNNGDQIKLTPQLTLE